MFVLSVLLVGDFADANLSAAKEKVQAQLVQAGHAALYWDPEDAVMLHVQQVRGGLLRPVVPQVRHPGPGARRQLAQRGQRVAARREAAHVRQTKENFVRTIDWLHSWPWAWFGLTSSCREAVWRASSSRCPTRPS